jgi:ubiquinone/menaquinone biosynthesis C-methylase UbiE
MQTTACTIFDRMSALSDTIRSRLLLVLEQHELSVSELCGVLQLPQSTVSRHLKVLGDEGWLVSRAEGTSRLYRMSPDRLEPSALSLWGLVREQIAATAGAEQDAQRTRSVLAQRSSKSREFFSSAAGEWDRLRTEMFGHRADMQALLGLLDEQWTVGDLGCGTGQVAASVAPFARQVIAVDDSPAMLAAAQQRLSGIGNVDIRAGELERLPIEEASLDAAVLFLVLHHVPDPARGLSEARRVLVPGGRLLIVDMAPHEREEYRQQMGHVWLGFSDEQLGRWVQDAGLVSYRYRALPADPAATGPTLVAAAARKPA